MADRSKEFRFGLIGCGRVVQDLHLPAWSAIPNAHPVAICDSSQASLDAVARKLPYARRYTNVNQFLADSGELAFVILATPGATHLELGKEILGRKLNLLCEKPLTFNARDAQSLIELADHNAVTLCCIHNYRFKENTQLALHALGSGRLGDVVAVNLKFRSGSLFGEQTPWRKNERENRTLLFDSGIHLVDIALMFLGPVTSLRFVEADVDSLGLQRVIFGTAHQNGSRGVFDLMVDASCTSTEIEILGESAGLSLQFFPNGFRMLPGRDDPLRRSIAEGLRLLDFAGKTIADKLLRRQCPHRARSHAQLFRAFVASLAGEAPNPVPGSEVLRTIELLDEVAMKAYGASIGRVDSAQNGIVEIATESRIFDSHS